MKPTDIRSAEQMRLNLEAVLFAHHGLPRLNLVQAFPDRCLWALSLEFLAAIEKHPRFRSWNAVGNHGTLADVGWREDVPSYSVQVVRWRNWAVEADVDIANPDYGVYHAVRHLFRDVLHLGKSDPFSVRAGLMKRGVSVPLAKVS